tara:strand:+ start:826 stop:1620 length:795 start_codon:yes stop_codon:yes gene_type:complete
MPNVRMTSAQMKAKAKAAAAKNKAKSKIGSPNKKKGAAKPAAKAKNAKVYKRIKSTSTYKPKFEKVSDEKLELASPAKMSKSSKYGKKHDKLRSKAKKLDNKSMDPKKPVSDKKFNKLQDKRDKKVDKAKNIRKKVDSPMNMSGRSYDMKMAYDKKLTPKARLHYLENERHDKDSAMNMGSPYEKKGSPYHMGHKKSPMNKELVGKQHNLPEHLKKKIEAAPEMKGSPYHMSNELKYGGPVIDQMKSLSQASSFKVLKHMKSKI